MRLASLETQQPTSKREGRGMSIRCAGSTMQYLRRVYWLFFNDVAGWGLDAYIIRSRGVLGLTWLTRTTDMFGDARYETNVERLHFCILSGC